MQLIPHTLSAKLIVGTTTPFRGIAANIKNLLYGGLASLLLLILSSCSSQPRQLKTGIDATSPKQLTEVHETGVYQPISAPLSAYPLPTSEQIVVIFSHGVKRPQKRENCNHPNTNPPESLIQLSAYGIRVFKHCSYATESGLPAFAGRQIYKRMDELRDAVNYFRASGISANHIFLAGHSNGAWASLMLESQSPHLFNAVIAFAPAFAGPRSETSINPWWRKDVRPKQIKQMLRATQLKALVFAYANDRFNRPQDLHFLSAAYPHSVKLIRQDCGHKSAHTTHMRDCNRKMTEGIIYNYINASLSSLQ